MSARSLYARVTVRDAAWPPPMSPQKPGETRLVAMSRSRLAVLLLVVTLGIAGAFLGPSALFPDAPAPAMVAPYVDLAREDLASNLNEHAILPIHLQFLRADCAPEGGAALLFEQRTFPYLAVRYAYAMSATWPPNAWSGGANLTEPVDHDLAKFLGGREVPCR